jgi:multidrug efflux system membrane fusion protein
MAAGAAGNALSGLAGPGNGGSLQRWQDSSVKTRTLVLLGLLLAATLGYLIVRDPAGLSPPRAAAPGAPVAVPATVARVETRDVPIWLSGIGSVQPLNAVTVKVRVDGQLDHVAFTEGQEVRQGDVLAQIDPRMYHAALDQAVAKQAQDAASLANARIDLARYQKLAANAYTSAQQADTQKAAVAQLEAQVQQDQAAVAMVQLQLDFTTIRAPLDGRVGLRLVDPGSIVHATDLNGIVTITQMAPVGALFAVPQDDLPDVRTAMANGDVPVETYSRDSGRLLATGRLVFVDSVVDQATGQIKLKAEFENADRALWPGQFINARVLLRTIRQATVVPARAVERGQDGTYLFRIMPDDTVFVQPVTLGSVSDSLAVVTKGTVPGDQIVIGGQYRLRAGMLIEPRATP